MFNIYYKLLNLIGKLVLLYKGVKFKEGLILYSLPIISVAKDSTIKFGKRVVICSTATHTAMGVNHRTVIRTLHPSAQIIIGNDVGMSGATICAAKMVHIGSYTMLGANVSIVDTDFHTLDPYNRRYNKEAHRINKETVLIGNNVFIGANTIILKGVKIGENSVIGAGSVVTSSIPENVIAAGNPCRVISNLQVEKDNLKRGFKE
jgi:bifunctional N-acetylglucosamine-1-phosphate-uridyltransferase/glucosamine-1-phosphate-acetyltransferase GlmU-like protein